MTIKDNSVWMPIAVEQKSAMKYSRDGGKFPVGNERTVINVNFSILEKPSRKRMYFHYMTVQCILIVDHNFQHLQSLQERLKSNLFGVLQWHTAVI